MSTVVLPKKQVGCSSKKASSSIDKVRESNISSVAIAWKFRISRYTICHFTIHCNVHTPTFELFKFAKTM
jgi:hypothetical protein